MQIDRSLVVILFFLTAPFSLADEIEHELVDVSLLHTWPDGAPLDIPEEPVVVLDFFAYWCGPCVQLSRQLHTLQQELALSGLDLKVVPVNVEKRNPSATLRFMKQAGIEKAFFDPSGEWIDSFQIKNLPFVAVLRNRGKQDDPEYEWVHTFRQRPSTAELREVIEAGFAEDPATGKIVASEESPETQPKVAIPIQAKRETIQEQKPAAKLEIEKRPAIKTSSENQPEPTPVNQSDHRGQFSAANTSGELTSTITGVFDRLNARDVEISNLSTTGSIERRKSQLGISWSQNRSRVDYAPSKQDLVGAVVSRSEKMDMLSLDGYHDLGLYATALISLSAYRGFTDYKSVWIDEFYRQQFELFPEYVDVKPKGRSIALGGRWEYSPAQGTVDLLLGYQYDRISPAFEAIPFEPLQVGLVDLDSWSLSLVFENVINERIRIKQRLQAVDTTARKVRSSYFGSAHIAVSEDLVLRFDLGSTVESSDFDSLQSAVSLEYDIEDRWFFHGFARWYEDSGEIVDPTIISTAAPALDTQLFGFGFTWRGETWAFHSSYGWYETHYDPVPASSFQFENLYRERTWDYARAQISKPF